MFNKIIVLVICFVASHSLIAMDRNKSAEALFKEAAQLEEIGDKEKAAEIYRKAAQKGHSNAQYISGLFSLEQYAASKDRSDSEAFNDAKKWFLQAANQGHELAQFNLALTYQKECAKADNPQQKEELILEALKWYRAAAIKQNLDAQNNLASLYLERSKTSSDTAQKMASLNNALEWFEKAGERGSVPAQYNAGKLFTMRMVSTKDSEKKLTYMRKAVGWLSKASDGGIAEASLELASLCSKAANNAREANNSKSLFDFAEQYLLKATRLEFQAQSDNGIIFNDIGLVLKEKGTKDRALASFEKAASYGNAEAAYNAGVLYHEMSNTQKEPQSKELLRIRAKNLFLIALRNKIPSAFSNLGIMCLEESEQMQDSEQKRDLREKALNYFIEASQLGVARATYNLAGLYIEKFHATNDSEKKKEFLRLAIQFKLKAVQLGYDQAASDLASLKTLINDYITDNAAKNMLLQQIDAVEKQAAQASANKSLDSELDQKFASALLEEITKLHLKSSDQDNQKILCASCKEPATNKCSGCHTTYYCSEACQRGHWKTHKPDCKPKQESKKK